MLARLKHLSACLLGFTLIVCLAGGASAQSGQAQKSVATISPTSCTSTGTAPNGAITFGVAPAGDPFDCDSDIPWVLSNPVTVTPHGQTGVEQPLNCPVTFSFTVTDVDSAQTQAVVVSATFTGTARATTFPTAVSNVTMSPSSFTLGCRQYSFLRTSYTIPQVGSAGSFGVEVSCQCVAPTIISCPPNQEVACSSNVPDCLTLQQFVDGGFLSGPIPATCTPTLSCTDAISNQTGTNCFTITRTYSLTTTEPTSVCPSSTCTQTITVSDTVAPVLSGCPATTASVQCPANIPAAPTVTATDNCEGDLGTITPTVTDTGAGTCPRTITRTWTATDACGNTASCTQTITVQDTTPPVITLTGASCGGSATQACTDTTPHFPAATANDNCDGPLTPTFTDTSSTAADGTITYTRTWNVSDACGNAATPCTFRVIIPKCVGVGRMTGGGSIFQSCGAEVSDAVLTNGRITHGFEIHCDVTHLPNNLEINWKDCTTGKQRKFKLTTLTSATCLDTPAQQYPPDAPFDTFIGTGTGILDNDKKPATISFTFVDAGEPGINDTEAITIKDSNGNVVLSASGFLRKGNQQAHRDN